MPEKITAKVHLPGLDGLRGIAILAVLLMHFTDAVRADNILLGLIRSGWCGVDLFFVLSGFLITGILLDTKDRPHYFTNFYARRTLRIFPLYYAVLVIVLVVGPRFGIWRGIVRAIGDDAWYLWVYLTNFLAARRSQPFPLVHLWSLAIEEQFYLVWPTIVYFVPRRKLLATCFGLAAAAVGCRAVIGFRLGPHWSFYATPCRLDALAFGAALACLAREPIGLQAWRQTAKWVGGVAAIPLLTILLSRHQLPMLDPEFLVWGPTLLATISAAAIVFAARPGPRLARFLTASPLMLAGKYSYAAYVLHPFIMGPMARLVPPGRLAGWLLGSYGLASVAYVLTGITATFVLAVFSWAVLERPVLTLKRFFEYR